MYTCVYTYISVCIYVLNILKHKVFSTFWSHEMSKIIERKPWKSGSRSPLLEMVSESATEQSSHLLVLYQGVDHLQDGALWLLSKKDRFNWATVDGRNPANQLTGSLSQYVHGFVNPWCCGISSINRITKNILKKRNRISLSFSLFTREFRESPSIGYTSSIPSLKGIFLGLKENTKSTGPKACSSRESWSRERISYNADTCNLSLIKSNSIFPLLQDGYALMHIIQDKMPWKKKQQSKVGSTSICFPVKILGGLLPPYRFRCQK